MTDFLVDRPIVTISSPREARPGECVEVDANEPTDVSLPPARTCPGAEVVIKEVAGGEEATTVHPAEGDTIEGQPTLRITGAPVAGVNRYVRLVSNGRTPGNWMILGHHGLR